MGVLYGAGVGGSIKKPPVLGGGEPGPFRLKKRKVTGYCNKRSPGGQGLDKAGHAEHSGAMRALRDCERGKTELKPSSG